MLAVNFGLIILGIVLLVLGVQALAKTRGDFHPFMILGPLMNVAGVIMLMCALASELAAGHPGQRGCSRAHRPWRSGRTAWSVGILSRSPAQPGIVPPFPPPEHLSALL